MAVLLMAAVEVAKFLCGHPTKQTPSKIICSKKRKQREEEHEDEESDEDDDDNELSKDEDPTYTKKPTAPRKVQRRTAPSTTRIAPRAADYGMTMVKKVLTEMNLAQYAEKFEEEGYDDLRFLAEYDETKLQALAEEVEMKRGHAARFIAWFKREAEKVIGGSSS